jgi:hypothetical protein
MRSKGEINEFAQSFSPKDRVLLGDLGVTSFPSGIDSIIENSQSLHISY